MALVDDDEDQVTEEEKPKKKSTTKQQEKELGNSKKTKVSQTNLIVCQKEICLKRMLN
jgi:hypothetical protein